MTVLVGGLRSGVGKTVLMCALGQRLRNACAVKLTIEAGVQSLEVVSGEAGESDPDKDTGRYGAAGFAASIWLRFAPGALREAARFIDSLALQYQYTVVEGNSIVTERDFDTVIFVDCAAGSDRTDRTPGSTASEAAAHLKFVRGRDDIDAVMQPIETTRRKRTATLITGDVGCGKTEWCRRKLLGNPHNPIDGILLPKVFQSGASIGYDVERIRTGERRPFARLKGLEPADWIVADSTGRYTFSSDGIEAGRAWIADAAAERGLSLLIDEIGPLETHGRGLSDALVSVLADPPHHVYVVVRRQLADAVTRRFGITGCHNLEVC